MHWNHSSQYWWLIPVLIILICFAMCLLMGRRGTLGCCSVGRGWRAGWRERSTDGGEDRQFAAAPSTPAERRPQDEDLKTTVQDLEHRLRSLEERLGAKEIAQNPPSGRS